MDLMSNCTLVFYIDAIVLHTNPDTRVGVGVGGSRFTQCCVSPLLNVEIHRLYVSFML